ncbi:hypothetical protein N0V92_008277 [Colletotrichum tropicale]|nr:hypothetical protein N0V92_008277 [Colletotrichum tropicale]
MDPVTIASYVTNVNNHILQNTKYHSALEDLHRAEEEKWTAQINSERKHSSTTNQIHLGVYLDFDEAKTPRGKLYKQCERVRKRKEKSDMLFSKAGKRFIPFRTKYEAAMQSLAKANRRLISANTEYIFTETLKTRKEKEQLAQLACRSTNRTIKIEALDGSLLDIPEVKSEAFPEGLIVERLAKMPSFSSIFFPQKVVTFGAFFACFHRLSGTSPAQVLTVSQILFNTSNVLMFDKQLSEVTTERVFGPEALYQPGFNS